MFLNINILYINPATVALKLTKQFLILFSRKPFFLNFSKKKKVFAQLLPFILFFFKMIFFLLNWRVIMDRQKEWGFYLFNLKLTMYIYRVSVLCVPKLWLNCVKTIGDKRILVFVYCSDIYGSFLHTNIIKFWALLIK